MRIFYKWECLITEIYTCNMYIPTVLTFVPSGPSAGASGRASSITSWYVNSFWKSKLSNVHSFKFFNVNNNKVYEKGMVKLKATLDHKLLFRYQTSEKIMTYAWFTKLPTCRSLSSVYTCVELLYIRMTGVSRIDII